MRLTICHVRVSYKRMRRSEERKFCYKKKITIWGLCKVYHNNLVMHSWIDLHFCWIFRKKSVQKHHHKVDEIVEKKNPLYMMRITIQNIRIVWNKTLAHVGTNRHIGLTNLSLYQYVNKSWFFLKKNVFSLTFVNNSVVESFTFRLQSNWHCPAISRAIGCS